MPRQNRITPTSEIIATPARGLFMGNRGRLHDEQGKILRSHVGKRWILCRLDFKGRRRHIMKPGFYTELFFLDEATALAAGHRPCGECMHERSAAFRDAWLRGNPQLSPGASVSPAQLDARLHEERLAGKLQRTHRARAGSLPSGVFVRAGGDSTPFLILANRLLRWSPDGYRAAHPMADDSEVEVLTPASVVGALRAGYRPRLHPSTGEVAGVEIEPLDIDIQTSLFGA